MQITCVAFRGHTTTLQDHSIKQRYGTAVLFLREACLLGPKVLSMKGCGKGKGKAKQEANLEAKRGVDGESDRNQLEEQLKGRKDEPT